MVEHRRRVVIGVMGGADPDLADPIMKQAETAGRLIAEAGAVLLCGGRTGIMEAASRGAKSIPSGEVLAVLPGSDPDGANPYVDLALATGMGNGRNIINVLSSDAVIAFHGGPGTLSEIALAVKCGIHTIGVETWNLRDAGAETFGGDARRFYHQAHDAEEAVALALRLARKRSRSPDEIRSSILKVLESRIQSWNAGDADGFSSFYMTADDLTVTFDGRRMSGTAEVTTFFRTHLAKHASEGSMKIVPSSLRIVNLPGGTRSASYRCTVDKGGSAGKAWIFTTLLLAGEGDYRIGLEHVSRGVESKKRNG
jgi:uncharacterized protein (TIGR00725 family)